MALSPDALTTPDRVRAAQGWSPSSHPDARLIPKINGLSRRISELTGRRFGFRRYTSESPLFVAGNGSAELWLDYPMVRDLTSVSITGQVLTLRQATLDNFAAYPDGVFRSEEWDAIGKLLRPQGWPRGGCGTWGDGTGHPRISAPTAWTVSLVGDFGFILPQYDGEADSVHNPDEAVSDLPADLEGILFSELDENFSTFSGNVRKEKTAGGYEVEFSDTVMTLSWQAKMVEKLGSYMMPYAQWAG